MIDIMLKILFVCVGNSCRSPMAEAVLRNLTTANIINASAEPQWLIDSAALADWNVGRLPEPRAIQVLANNGLHSEHIARQITEDDFYQFDYIFGMDDMNIEHLLTMSPPDATARIELLGRYDYGRPEVIADPYFGHGIAGFEIAFEQIHRSCLNLFAKHNQPNREPLNSHLSEEL